MKKILLFTLFLLFPALAYAQPSIVFDAEEYDFGTVEKGNAMEHTFDFANAGDEELIIEKLVPS